MGSYRLTRRANADLDEIADYLGERSPSAVNRVLNALQRTFEFLADHPEAGSLRDDLRPNLALVYGEETGESLRDLLQKAARGRANRRRFGWVA